MSNIYNTPKAAIIGLGHMGQKIGRILNQFELPYLSIDPAITGTDYKYLEEIPQGISSGISFWFVCVPTELHYTVTKQIYQQTKRTRIMVEKPLAYEHEMEKFRLLAQSSQQHYLCINNHYEDCIILQKALQEINSPIKAIQLEFCKNRSSDIARGRFVDNYFHVWGYEGFHILYLLSFFLQETSLKEYDLQKTVKSFYFDTSSISSWTVAESTVNNINITIRLSTNGISFDENSAFLQPNQRKRRISIELENGGKIIIGFGESCDNAYQASQEYWIKVYNANEQLIFLEQLRDNPLKTHIQGFINGEKKCTKNNFTQGWKLTQLLEQMVRQNIYSYTSLESQLL